MCSLNCWQQFNFIPSNRWCGDRNRELVPAEVWGENVNALVLGEQRMESAPVRPVDAVALVGIPEGQLAAIEHVIILLPF